MVIDKVARQKACEMPLVEDDHMVQTFPAETPDEALCVRMLPGNPVSEQGFLDASGSDALPKVCAIDAVLIAYEIVRRLVSQHPSTTCGAVHAQWGAR
jgi:hypothetical protein